MDIDKVNKELNHENSAYWENVAQLPPLLFDHLDMVSKAIEKLRERIQRKPVGFQLLPRKFTLTQLQQLYEVILAEPLDKRNFRKRILEMTFIEKTEEKDRQSSKRGAALYKFNDSVYQREPNFKL